MVFSENSFCKMVFSKKIVGISVFRVPIYDTPPMYAFMYACMYVRTYVRMYVCMYV